MELSFRTYGMIGAFITIGILVWVQLSVTDMLTSPSGFLWTVLGLSAGGVLFVIECLDFWRYVAALRLSARLPLTCCFVRTTRASRAQDLRQPSRVRLLRATGHQDILPGQISAELLLSRPPVLSWRDRTHRGWNSHGESVPRRGAVGERASADLVFRAPTTVHPRAVVVVVRPASLELCSRALCT